MNTAEFIASLQITAEAFSTDSNPNMNSDSDLHMDHWRVVLKRPGAKMTVYYSMGTGHNGRAPEAAEVLDCLAMDAAGVDGVGSFEEWAKEYDVDTDSRKALRTYNVCKRQGERLRKFLGGAYDELLWKTERE